MYGVISSRQFKKSLKKVLRRDKSDETDIKAVVLSLRQGFILAPRHKDHQLSGVYHAFRECHIKNDLLLRYRIDGKFNILHLADVGNHQDFFGK